MRYVFRRLASSIPTLVGITVLVFVLVQLSPGDPVARRMGPDYDPRIADLLREQLGLNRPLAVQYVDWLGSALRGDLGVSLYQNRPVSTLIGERLGTTGLLALGTLAIAVSIAIPLGVISAVYRGKAVDDLSRVLAMIGISMPVFWVGLILIIVFAYYLPVLPAGGSIREHGLKALILPSVSLGISFAALMMRVTRASMVDVLGQDYIRTSFAKGVRPRRIHYLHALKNAILPVLTVFGLQMGSVLGGAVLTETIFSLPGIGRLLVQSIDRRDYPVIQGTVLFIALVFVVTNTVIDLLYGLVDPRVRYS